MSFASDCKKEICLTELDKSCCEMSEICGLYLSIGSLSLLGRGKLNVQFITESIAVARRVYTLLVKRLDIFPQIHYITHARFGGTRKCVLTLGPIHSPTLLIALGLMEKNEDDSVSFKYSFPRLPISKSCCMRAFLRGAFLGNGTMTSPEQGYHLEIGFMDDDTRALLAKCIQKLSLPIHQSARGEQKYLYFKQADQIVTFLTALGASSSVMHIEELRIQRQIFGKVTRAMNCDQANLQKQLDAGQKQVQGIQKLMESEIFETLPATLREMAELRLQQPSLPLSELGQLLDPPLGKSGVNHRMRRLMSYVDTITHLNSHKEEQNP